MEYRPLIDRDLTDRAVSFMKKSAEAQRPFFLYLPYTAMHFPTMPRPDFKGRSGKRRWGDWKIHLKEQSGWNGVLREYTMPRVYNLINDPF